MLGSFETTTSENLNELATALAKAQGEMENAEKTQTNSHFKSKYADLASVINAIRVPLSKNGLAYIQVPLAHEEQWFLKTRLMHTTGQYLESLIPILVTKQDAHGFGSGLSYARRYSLSALVGISQEDDDGNGAVENPDGAKPQPKPATAPKPPPPQKKAVSTTDVNRLYSIAKAKKWDEAMINEVKAAFEVTKWVELEKEKFDWVCDSVEKGMQPEGMVAIIKAQKPNSHNEPQPEVPNGP